jgi:16S rRNA (adenine1518-N6/adenine1519-N6)-dimethyltransferase
MAEPATRGTGTARVSAPPARRTLARLGVLPYKGWGQNFLIDEAVPGQIVAVAGVAPGDLVLEVGPGLGVLTEPLLAAGATVVAVEIDTRLAGELRQRFSGQQKLRLIEGDILRLPLEEVMPGGDAYTVVANLPYSVTSAVVRHLLSSPRRPARIVVMIQREVAERIVAAPPHMSLLAVSVQFFGQPRLALHVPASAFYPVPAVDSAVVSLVVQSPPLPDAEQTSFFRVVAAGFGQRRKTLANSLAAGLDLPRAAVVASLRSAGIDPQRRAETLTVDDWVGLYRAVVDRPREG